MNNEEFKFFLHGTTVSNPDMVKDIFNNGLLNYITNDMLSTMWPVDVGNNAWELGDLVKKYCGIKGNTVFIIKIPKYYLTPIISSNGQLMQIPLPIWRTVIDKYGNEISQLSPELVYSVYVSDNDSLLFNSNYSKVHDPSGLKFDNQQIDYLAINGLVSWNDFAASRRSKSYKELKRYDFDNNTWSETIQQYKNHFCINQLKNR